MRALVAEAKTAGFRGNAFNLVVSTNEGAVKLWQRMILIVAAYRKRFDIGELGLG